MSKLLLKYKGNEMSGNVYQDQFNKYWIDTDSIIDRFPKDLKNPNILSLLVDSLHSTSPDYFEPAYPLSSYTNYEDYAKEISVYYDDGYECTTATEASQREADKYIRLHKMNDLCKKWNENHNNTKLKKSMFDDMRINYNYLVEKPDWIDLRIIDDYERNFDQLQELCNVWDDFSNVSVDEDDKIDEDFLQFPKGYNKYDIWKWFENESNMNIDDFINFCDSRELV